jgi:hypothetical protein
MAFNIPLDPHGTGMEASYWRITQAHIDHVASQVTVWLHGWRDAAARAEGRLPAASLSFILHADDVAPAGLHGLTTAHLYEALKSPAAALSAAPILGSADHAILAAAKDC